MRFSVIYICTKKLLHNLENRKSRYVHITSEQKKKNVNLKSQSWGKKYTFQSMEKGDHRHVYRHKMSRDELFFKWKWWGKVDGWSKGCKWD